MKGTVWDWLVFKFSDDNEMMMTNKTGQIEFWQPSKYCTTYPLSPYALQNKEKKVDYIIE